MASVVLLLILQTCIGTNTLYAQNAELVTFEKSTCYGDHFIDRLNERIIHFEQKGDSLKIKIVIKANCCMGDFGSCSISNDTLHLKYNLLKPPAEPEKDSSGFYFEYCDCDCFFHLRYVIHHLNSDRITTVDANGKSLVINEQPYKLTKIKYELYKTDTINKFDQHGFKQGPHIAFDKNKRKVADVIYRNDTLVSGFTHRQYFDKGELQSETVINPNDSRTKTYYSLEGKIIKSCTYKDVLEYIDHCDE